MDDTGISGAIIDGDIGLIDTMMDTLSHLIGAVLFCALASSTRFKRLRRFTRLFINQGVMGD